ncbi:hypothetical protein GCM10009864_31590 [Streptomyces lunalinharesii]|uniref:Uncharacterized protein n=1 Tax=Streptomyces lunalinharesii TaxID=333384 RepID=A0ABN3RVK2_9ACTN
MARMVAVSTTVSRAAPSRVRCARTRSTTKPDTDPPGAARAWGPGCAGGAQHPRMRGIRKSARMPWMLSEGGAPGGGFAGGLDRIVTGTRGFRSV